MTGAETFPTILRTVE